ncbi:hypothetical protein LTR09_006203 [Extremus antarcticus]|uniref:NAD(P)-binding domain-containing protein n=1 Tax=Extremus antarcticus TaxID=702011 RepID=A0AAJ0G8U1_9PEZI|nr:hypothetical protein LTR09_006203 [Extremus antarcticus]
MAGTDTPKIALLGSTGKAGREVLRILLERGDHDLHIYVRSRAKLEDQFPGIGSKSNVAIAEGSVSNTETVKTCLSGATVIICTLGSNDFEGSTILRESAKSILDALKELRKEQGSRTAPRMIYLSSSSQNKRFAAARPPGVDWLIKTAFQKGYEDLTAAESMLLAEADLVSLLRVQPGILIEEEGTGHEISTESVRLAASYPDLAQSFVELALNRSHDTLSEIGASSKGGDRVARYAPIILSRITGGLFTVYCPGGSAARRVLLGLSATVALTSVYLGSSVMFDL